jgi:hypothetical protein
MKLDPKYICDKCGMSSDFLDKVFEKQDSNPRLCEPCNVAFRELYHIWCGRPVIARKKKFFGII